MARVVVIVDPYSSAVMYAPALRRAGFSPVAVVSDPEPATYFTSTFRAADFDRTLRATTDGDRLVDRLAVLDPVAVLPGSESGVELADALAARLTPARANAPALARARRHKGEMVRAVRAAGLATIPSVCSNDPCRVDAWLAEAGLIGADLVVKPALSAATDGVTLVPGGHGWRAVMDGLRGRCNAMGVINDEIMVQRRAVGTEYVVDTFSHGGRHTVTDICRYGKLHNGPHFAVYEHVDFLPYDAPGHPELIRYVSAVLDAVGFRFGPAHTEVMVAEDGPRLIEVNARLAGSGLPGAAQLATGETAVDRLIRFLMTGADIRTDFTLRRCVMTAFFVAPRAGVLSNVEAYDRIRSLRTCRHLRVNVRDGDRIAATPDLFSSMRLGFALLVDRDPERMRADYATLRAIAAEVRSTVQTWTSPPRRSADLVQRSGAPAPADQPVEGEQAGGQPSGADRGLQQCLPSSGRQVAARSSSRQRTAAGSRLR